MSRPILTTVAITLLSVAGLAHAEPPVSARSAIPGQGDAALATMQAEFSTALPVIVSLPPLNAQAAETVELGYLIAAQGDAALENVERQLPATIQADLALPELSVTTHFASATSLPPSPTEI